MPRRTSLLILLGVAPLMFLHVGCLNPQEPEERELMDAAERGSLVHAVLERFFLHMQALGRPKQYEAWTADAGFGPVQVEPLAAVPPLSLLACRRR